MSSMFYEAALSDSTTQEAMRPGGLRLTEDSLKLVNLQPGWSVLDVACGAGATLHLLTRRFKCHAYGIDLSARILKKARAKLSGRSHENLAELIRADSEFLPLREGLFDAVICECSLSLFPNKLRALNKMVEVLKVGGKALITDVTLKDPTLKNAESIANWCLCVAGAETIEGYINLLERSGMKVLYWKDASDAYDWGSADPEQIRPLLGRIGYAVIIGAKP
ncbi:MAG: class I SAM-dependent methyltransferase [Candidatus Nezhaarchaeota archaeon]|nr:class I SAM-dependent methyltransferase [Candidatus Nezhaarchaeota archaeon]